MENNNRDSPITNFFVALDTCKSAVVKMFVIYHYLKRRIIMENVRLTYFYKFLLRIDESVLIQRVSRD